MENSATASAPTVTAMALDAKNKTRLANQQEASKRTKIQDLGTKISDVRTLELKAAALFVMENADYLKVKRPKGDDIANLTKRLEFFKTFRTEFGGFMVAKNLTGCRASFMDPFQNESTLAKWNERPEFSEMAGRALQLHNEAIAAGRTGTRGGGVAIDLDLWRAKITAYRAKGGAGTDEEIMFKLGFPPAIQKILTTPQTVAPGGETYGPNENASDYLYFTIMVLTHVASVMKTSPADPKVYVLDLCTNFREVCALLQAQFNGNAWTGVMRNLTKFGHMKVGTFEYVACASKIINDPFFSVKSNTKNVPNLYLTAGRLARLTSIYVDSVPSLWNIMHDPVNIGLLKTLASLTDEWAATQGSAAYDMVWYIVIDRLDLLSPITGHASLDAARKIEALLRRPPRPLPSNKNINYRPPIEVMALAKTKTSPKGDGW